MKQRCWTIITRRYSSGAQNMEVFLKGHAGSHTVTRQTRREYIDAPALTIDMAIRSEVLQAIGRIREPKAADCGPLPVLAAGGPRNGGNGEGHHRSGP